jgi:hypothetical protein
MLKYRRLEKGRDAPAGILGTFRFFLRIVLIRLLPRGYVHSVFFPSLGFSRFHFSVEFFSAAAAKYVVACMLPARW